jgi:hypothetical protein
MKVGAQMLVGDGFPGDADRGLRPHSVFGSRGGPREASLRTSVRASTLACGRTPLSSRAEDRATAERRLESRMLVGPNGDA